MYSYRKLVTSCFLLICLGLGPFAISEDAAPTSGFRAEYLQQLDDVAKKLVDLAEATPKEKFSWRPAEGVRSISEVYIHIAGANYFIPKFAGIEPPQPLSQDMEKTITDKAKVIETMQKSIEHVRQAVLKASDADLDKAVTLFGNETTFRGLLFLLANHMHEHLGQSIAYARTNGIVPPWSAAGGN